MGARDERQVIIGAASGIGQAVAQRLAAEGPLILADRNERSLASLQASLSPEANTTCVTLDVTDVDAVGELAASCGAFRSLVVTAGLSPTMGDAAQILEVNLIGTANVLHAFGPSASEGSVAVCFSSGAGHMPLEPEIYALLDDPLAPGLLERIANVLPAATADPGMAYIVSKAGVIRLAAITAVAWGPRRARVVSLSPGTIDTPMAWQEAKQFPFMVDRLRESPFQRAGQPAEVAEVVRFLCSPEASWINGCDVRVDGGAAAMQSQIAERSRR